MFFCPLLKNILMSCVHWPVSLTFLCSLAGICSCDKYKPQVGFNYMLLHIFESLACRSNLLILDISFLSQVWRITWSFIQEKILAFLLLMLAFSYFFVNKCACSAILSSLLCLKLSDCPWKISLFFLFYTKCLNSSLDIINSVLPVFLLWLLMSAPHKPLLQDVCESKIMFTL